MGIDRRREGFSEEFTNDDLRPEDYEKRTEEGKKESPNAPRLDEQDKNGKYCSYYDYPADYGREK